MDAVTGLSRRQAIALIVLLILGIGASTLVTLADEKEEGCPDERYGCATFEPGEPIVLGLLFPTAGGPNVRAVRLAVELRGGELLGRPLELEPWATGCDPEGGAEGARELAGDPPDQPPVALVLGGTCSPSTTPAAQILSDSGITLVSPAATPPPPAGALAYHLRIPPLPPEQTTVYALAYTQRYGPPGPETLRSGIGTERALDAIVVVAFSDADGRLLVPRTPLRDTLIEAGLLLR